MFKTISSFIFLLVPFIGFSQLTQGEAETLRQELATRINTLRKSKGLNPLIFNDTLKRAAEFHSNYMAENDELEHTEKQAKYATPMDRVYVFGGKIFELIGENILFISSPTSPMDQKAIATMADEMFKSWKNSPGHYANMIHPEYVYGDLGFKANLKKRAVFATNVFGTKGYVVPNQLSTDTFQLSKAPKNCEKDFEEFSNIVMNMGNGIAIDGNEVLLYESDIDHFKRIFNHPGDGLAIDLVSEEQLECGKPNQLDMSPIYDGILLKPYYVKEMLAGNRAQSNYRLITKVADIPAHLMGKNFSPSIVLIKNHKACKHIYQASVPSKDYKLRPFEPIVKNDTLVTLVREGIIYSQFVNYDFKTNLTKSVKLPNIEQYNAKVHSVKIKSYSSVEGDSVENAQLHNSRADFIKKHVLSKVEASDDLFTIDAKENWEQMAFQLNYFGEGRLEGLSHDSIKSIIAKKTLKLPWDSIFYNQRKSLAIINYTGSFNGQENNESLAEFNLRTAVITGNARLANKALYEMYRSPGYTESILFEPQIIDFFKKEHTAIGNYAALLSQHFSYDPYIVSEVIHSWLNRTNQLDTDSKTNLLHLYTLVGSYLLANWDVSAERLSNVIHPRRIEELEPDEIKPELALNLHLTFINYFGQINDIAKIIKSFNYISNYFDNIKLKKEDDVELSLFFNFWSRYDLTIDHLLPRFKKNELNEEGLFILAQTMNFSDKEENNSVFIGVTQRAIKTNKKRWCEWIKKDFQVKRNPHVKRLYCETCK